MDEQIIRREASAALDDLELDAQVTAVTRAGENWCIQFGGDYGQFCDEFKDLFGHASSPRVVREKVKKHLLGQVTQLRNKGRRRTGRRDVEAPGPDVAELFQDAVEQTTRVVTEAIDRTVGLAGAGLKAVAETAESLNPNAAPELTAAPAREARSTPAPLAAKSVAAKKASSRHETAAKKSGTKKRASKTLATRKGRTTKAAKKAAGKKSGRKK